MVEYKYGAYEDLQFDDAIVLLRKQIYFLLLIVDKRTREQYGDVDVIKSFINIQHKIAGLNELLFYPKEIVTITSLLERAMREFQSPSFDFCVYRKLILDAGNEVLKIKADSQGETPEKPREEV